MGQQTDPNFAEILGPAIQSVPDSARPALLALLERGAAGRYEQWAASETQVAGELRACAARELQIADRIDQLFALDPAHESDVEKAIPAARAAYFAIFEGLPVKEQWRLQAIAERQGASAWRLLASQQEGAGVRAALEECAKLEEESAAALDALLAAS